MQPRCKRLSLLLTLCILLSVFTAFPTVSAVSVQPPPGGARQVRALCLYRLRTAKNA